jgi:nucleoside-diphosphate-sugar epimerase
VQVLVTGGAGFIGSHIVDELLRRGHSVRVLDTLITGRAENIAHALPHIEFIEGSIADPATAARAVQGCDGVLHQAAIPSVARSLEEPLPSNEANVTGTLTMLVAARDAGVKRFVYAGSSSAYGDNPELPKREEAITLPRSPYAVAKLAGEQYTRVFGRLFPMETVAFRYFNIFGPRQNPASKYAAVIPAFARAMIDGQPIYVDGDGEQSRDFTYVANAVLANMCALEAPGVSGELFNIGCGARYTLNNLVSELSEIIGVTPQVEHRPTRAGDVPHSLADISKARRLLGYEPIVNFREGLERVVASLRE